MRPSPFRLSLGLPLALVLVGVVGCRANAVPSGAARTDASAAVVAHSSERGVAPAPPIASAPPVAPHPAIAEIAKLPDVADFAKQSHTRDKPRLGRAVRPVLTAKNQVADDCEGDACLLTVDLTDESEIGAAEPQRRFYVHTKTKALFVEGFEPYPLGRMTYAAWTELRRQRASHEARILALPEVVAQAKHGADPKNVVPGCVPAVVDVRLEAVPEPGCEAGALGCRWHYAVHLPNGCADHLWVGFFVNPKTQALSVSDTAGFASLPYATWHARGGHW